VALTSSSPSPSREKSRLLNWIATSGDRLALRLANQSSKNFVTNPQVPYLACQLSVFRTLLRQVIFCVRVPGSEQCARWSQNLY
jgi:hypothetical protein